MPRNYCRGHPEPEREVYLQAAAETRVKDLRNSRCRPAHLYRDCGVYRKMSGKRGSIIATDPSDEEHLSFHPDTQNENEDKRGPAVLRAEQIAKSYRTYDEFLDSQVNEMDMYFLEDRSIARTIKELGFHGNSEKVTREQFDEIKSDQAVTKRIEDFKSSAKYLHTDRDVFLLELARREEANLNGRLVTIIYIRDRSAKGQEISSYIDYAQRLREEDFASIFAGRTRLIPNTTDISHYNWDTNVTHSNNTANFEIIFRGPSGIQLKCKKDRRLIHLDPYRKAKDENLEDTTRTLLRSRNYAQVVLFDHYIRFWANEDALDSADLGTQEQKSMEANFNLYDAVTAAIFEEDVLEIAKNALGGNLHQEHYGEWAPADTVMDSTAEAPAIPEAAPSQNLEMSVLGTIRDLYDAHKSDISFGTLGNFTFVQLIEQLGLLLPLEIRQQNEKELEEIASRTAVAKQPITEKTSEVIADVDELVERQRQKLKTIGSQGTEFARQENEADALSGSHKKQELHQIPNALFRANGEEEKLFDPAYHRERIFQLQPVPKNGSRPPEKNADEGELDNPFAQGLPSEDHKPSAESNHLNLKLGAKKRDSALQPPYFQHLENRMNDVFTGKPSETRAALPAYPKTADIKKM